MNRFVTLVAGILVGVLLGVGGAWWLWFGYGPDVTGANSTALDSPANPVEAPVSESPGTGHLALTEFERSEQAILAAMAAGEYQRAVDELLAADLVAALPAEQARVADLLDQAVDLLVEQLTADGEQRAIDQLYETLSLAMPERADFQLLLAEHRIDMGNPESALPVLAQIENHHHLGALAREMIEQISSESIDPADPASLPLVRSGNQFIAAALVDGQREVQLLIDTGASMTTLSPGVLEALGYRLGERVARFSTANGVLQAPVVEIESISLGSASVSGITVGALELSRPGGAVDGLLGMDVLQHFEFTLDQEMGRLELHSRRR